MVAHPDMDAVAAENPLIQDQAYSTLVSGFESGAETRKQKRLYPRRHIKLRYRNITRDEARTLWSFHKARRGRLEAFNFFLPWPEDYEGEYVGTGDGSTTSYNAPARDATGVTVYVDGTAQTGGGTDYTYTQGGGADGADLIEFVSAPSAGARITMDFSGVLKIRCRYEEDVMEWETFYTRLVTTGLGLRGLLNA